jgi:hypothetical protein
MDSGLDDEGARTSGRRAPEASHQPGGGVEEGVGALLLANGRGEGPLEPTQGGGEVAVGRPVDGAVVAPRLEDTGQLLDQLLGARIPGG